MFMLLPNGHFLALPPEFWPHWYFWDCACAARMSMVIFSSRVHPAAGACGARERSGVAGGGASAARRRRGHRIGISQRKTIGLFNGRLSAFASCGHGAAHAVVGNGPVPDIITRLVPVVARKVKKALAVRAARC